MTVTSKKTGLALLREPFPPHQISKLPKPTKAQTDAVRNDFKKGVRCKLCGGWHHPNVVHLDYVGHAALTDRLLDADPEWNWEPHTETRMPILDENNGMWIQLTVCGVTRLGYGHAEGKKGGDAIKEVIGDGLRNAAMRFGAALDLWHKGDLHQEDVEAVAGDEDSQGEGSRDQVNIAAAVDHLGKAGSLNDLKARWERLPKPVKANPDVSAAKEAAKERLSNSENSDLGYDEIPY